MLKIQVFWIQIFEQKRFKCDISVLNSELHSETYFLE